MWHVKMFISGIASFTGTDEQAAGADCSSSIPWHTVIPAALTIGGRLDSGGVLGHSLWLCWRTTTDSHPGLRTPPCLLCTLKGQTEVGATERKYKVGVPNMTLDLQQSIDEQPMRTLRLMIGQRFAGVCILLSAIAAHSRSILPWRLHILT